jgi:ABC-type polysaccharide/polyol phosphate export permease
MSFWGRGVKMETATLTFIFTSFLTLFLSNYSMRISNMMQAEVLELYATLDTKLGDILKALSIFYSIPLFVLYMICLVILIFFNATVNLILYLIMFCVLIVFLSRLGMCVGLIFRNPYKAGAMIPYLVFIALTITPINFVFQDTGVVKYLFLFNPLFALLQLLADTILEGSWNLISIISLGYISIITIIMEIYIKRKTTNSFILEKLI